MHFNQPLVPDAAVIYYINVVAMVCSHDMLDGANKDDEEIHERECKDVDTNNNMQIVMHSPFAQLVLNLENMYFKYA